MLSLLAATTPPHTTTTIIESDGGFGWSDFWFAIVTGVVAALIWWLLVEIIRRWRLRQNFKHLAGTYRVTRKLAPTPEAETLAISVRGCVLYVDYVGLEDGGEASAQILMNEQVPTSGAGKYTHTVNGEQLWGFLRRSAHR